MSETPVTIESLERAQEKLNMHYLQQENDCLRKHSAYYNGRFQSGYVKLMRQVTNNLIAALKNESLPAK